MTAPAAPARNLPPERFTSSLVGLAVAGLTAACLLATGFGSYVVSGVALVAALLAAGLALFALLPGTAPAAPVLRTAVLATATTAFAAALLSVPFDVMNVAGRGLEGLGDSLARDVVLRSGDAQSVLTMCAGAVAVIVGMRLTGRPRTSRVLLLAGAVALAGSLLITGHTRSHGPAAVVVACGLAHVLGAAGWFGGLVGLGLSLRRVRDDAAGQLVMTFAGLMTGVITMLLAGGTGLAMLYLPSFDALVHTAYGQVLLIKIAIVASVLVLSAANHRRLVPLAAEGRPGALAVLRMNVAVEQIGVVTVLLITDILMRQNPGG